MRFVSIETFAFETCTQEPIFGKKKCIVRLNLKDTVLDLLASITKRNFFFNLFRLKSIFLQRKINKKFPVKSLQCIQLNKIFVFVASLRNSKHALSYGAYENGSDFITQVIPCDASSVRYLQGTHRFFNVERRLLI